MSGTPPQRVAWKVTDAGLCIDIDGHQRRLVETDQFPELILMLVGVLQERVVRGAGFCDEP